MTFIRSLFIFVTGYVLFIGVSLVIAAVVLEPIDDNAYCPHRSYQRWQKKMKEDGLLL